MAHGKVVSSGGRWHYGSRLQGCLHLCVACLFVLLVTWICYMRFAPVLVLVCSLRWLLSSICAGCSKFSELR